MVDIETLTRLELSERHNGFIIKAIMYDGELYNNAVDTISDLLALLNGLYKRDRFFVDSIIATDDDHVVDCDTIVITTDIPPTKDEEEEQKAEAFLDTVTCDTGDCDLTAVQIVDYMHDNDELPEGVTLWQPFEDYQPKHLVEEHY